MLIADATSERNGGNERRQLLLRHVHGGYWAGLLVMEGPQFFRFGHQFPHILTQEKMCKEYVGLLARRESFQHGGQKLRGPPGTEGLHLEKLFEFLLVSELVRFQQSCLELRVWRGERQDSNQIQNPSYNLLAEGPDQLVKF